MAFPFSFQNITPVGGTGMMNLIFAGFHTFTIICSLVLVTGEEYE